ncbi:MoxR family ATPase [Sulfurovum sp.]|uniref:AAA family ATPase n=1 Tax=Sulfurovum sp. TaxID=1969726 RepID=UPI002867E3F1|nr:MoxR family ATPase [Sulfurovum sp.]
MTARESIELLQRRMNETIIGQEHVVDRLILGLLADGNILVEGLPGLAKTQSIKAMASTIESKFSRIQFTPDLLPSEVMGSERIYEEDGKRSYRFYHGAIFGNIILADEVNRAPARVQSAMLEAMEERQVTVAGKTYKLPELFIVMATQNPIEHEGTFPLSEAQKDRFLMHVKINYIDMESEFTMMKRAEVQRYKVMEKKAKIPQELIFAARKEASKVELSDALGHYIIELVFATRYPLRYTHQLDVLIELGVSPRATLALSHCAQVRAWMKGRDKVTVDDIHAIVHDVFRHRITLTEHAHMNNRTNDEIVDLILKQVKIPEKENA